MVYYYVSIPLLVVGALLYGFASGKASELGRLTFLAAILAIALHAESCARLHF